MEPCNGAANSSQPNTHRKTHLWASLNASVQNMVARDQSALGWQGKWRECFFKFLFTLHLIATSSSLLPTRRITLDYAVLKSRYVLLCFIELFLCQGWVISLACLISLQKFFLSKDSPVECSSPTSSLSHPLIALVYRHQLIWYTLTKGSIVTCYSSQRLAFAGVIIHHGKR